MSSAAAADVIDLLSDDDDEETPTKNVSSNKRRAASSATDEHDRRVEAKLSHESISVLTDVDTNVMVLESNAKNDDDEVQIVDAVSTQLLLHATNNNNTDDDVCIVGATGPNALEDFPHSRESCVKHPFSTNHLLYCNHCYCFVCDVVASDCPCWNQHCHAKYAQPKWRRQREEWKKNKSLQQAQPFTDHAYLHSAIRTSLQRRIEATAAGQRQRQQQDAETRARIRQVARNAAQARAAMMTPPPRTMPPRGAPPPKPKRPTAPPSQTLTAMKQLSSVENRPNLPNYSVRALLDYITEQSVMSPCSLVAQPQVLSTTLQKHELESLTFMNQVETGVTNTSVVTGGWLADEVGKTRVVLALVALNPMSSAPTKQQVLQFTRANNRTPRLKVKCTVILTSTSLMKKWQDECQKHAPSLVVQCYCPAIGKMLTRKHVADADIILSSSTVTWDNDFTTNFEFHRVVVDESHLLARSSLEMARRISGHYRWCLSETLFFSGTIFDLMPQICFLSPSANWQYDKELHIALYAFRDPSKTASAKQGFYMLADVLKKCVVRHTKSQVEQTQQQDEGSQARVHPHCISSTTIYLNMTPEEQQLFGYANTASCDALDQYVQNGGSIQAVQEALLPRMKDATVANSKIHVLVADLNELRRVKRAMRVVVYTQYKAMQDACVTRLTSLGYNVYNVDGSTSAAKDRDDMICNFQRDGKPAVFVVNLRNGSDEILLDGVAQVYLMEPLLDPAAELQAVGKNGPVKRFAFRYSVESNIVELHQEITTGRISLGDESFLPPEAVKILTKGIQTQSTLGGGASSTRLLEI